MKKIAVIILFLVISAVGYAEDKNSPKKMAETFFAGIQKGEISEAYDKLFIGSNIAKNKPQDVEMVKKQTQLGLSMFGSMIGYELVVEENYGGSLVRLVYLMKTDEHPLTWEFYFYRPKNTWFLANILFNDNFVFLRGIR